MHNRTVRSPTYEIRPKGKTIWHIVEHPGAMCAIEAVLDSGVPSSLKQLRSNFPCQIRLTEFDIKALLELPAVQAIAREILGKSTGKDSQNTQDQSGTRGNHERSRSGGGRR